MGENNMSINLINYALAKKDWKKAYEDLKVLEVGGRNLIKNSDFIVTATQDSFAPTTPPKAFGIINGIDLNETFLGKTVTFSYFVHTPGERESRNVSNGDRFGMHGVVTWENSATGETITLFPFAKYLTATVTNKRVSMQYTFTPPSGYDRIKSFTFVFHPFAKPSSGNEETWKLGYPKLEIGNRASDWTPAPEDINAHPFVAELAESVFRSKQNEERIRNLENAITSLGGGS